MSFLHIDKMSGIGYIDIELNERSVNKGGLGVG
jgi:hypothetical protein